MSSGGMSVPLSATLSGDRSGSNLALQHHTSCDTILCCCSKTSSSPLSCIQDSTVATTR